MQPSDARPSLLLDRDAMQLLHSRQALAGKPIHVGACQRVGTSLYCMLVAADSSGSAEDASRKALTQTSHSTL